MLRARTLLHRAVERRAAGRANGSYVYLVQPDMTLAQRPVTVARVAGDTTVIACSGLSGGELVVHGRPIWPQTGPEGVHFCERCRSPEDRRSKVLFLMMESSRLPVWG